MTFRKIYGIINYKIKIEAIKINSIYKITNVINGKVYIGKTSRSISQRFKEHIEFAKLGYDNMLIYRAIRKYGEDNFSIELIEDQINNKEIDNRERYWINYYHSYIHSKDCNGYNMTLGGDGVLKYDYPIELIIDLYESGKSSYQIAKELDFSNNSDSYIRSLLKSAGVQLRTNEISILQLDTNNILIQEFSSIKEANLYFNKPIYSRNISSCLNGKTKTAYGFKWQYK